MSVTTTSKPSTSVTTTTADDNTPAALKAGLERMRPQLSVALPAHIPVERFERVVLTAVNVTPELIQADRRSLFNACQRAAQDGLLPDGREAALVIFNTKVKQDNKDVWIKKVQYMPMVYGIIKKVRQSGEVVEFRSRIVYEKDTFRFVLGDDERIEHESFLGDAGKPIAVYAIAKGAEGWVEREVMTVAEVEKVRAVSKSSNNGPWVSWWTEMARKTVMRRLSKRLPISSEIMQAFEADDDLRGNDAPPPRPTRNEIEHDAGGDTGEKVETETKPYEAISADGEVNLFTKAADACAFVLAEFDRRKDAVQATSEHNAELIVRFEEEKAVDQVHAIRHWLSGWEQNTPEPEAEKPKVEAEETKRDDGATSTVTDDDEEDSPILPLPGPDGNRNDWLKAVIAQIDAADAPMIDRILAAVDKIEDMPAVLQAEITKAVQKRRGKLPKKA